MVSHTPVITFERNGKWGPLLRRNLENRGVRIRETISLADCWDECRTAQHNFAVLEFEPTNAVGVCDFIRRMRLCFPRAKVAIVGSRAMQVHEWSAREAGAQYAIFSPRYLEPLTRIVCRHADFHAKPPEQDFFDRLPWG